MNKKIMATITILLIVAASGYFVSTTSFNMPKVGDAVFDDGILDIHRGIVDEGGKVDGEAVREFLLQDGNEVQLFTYKTLDDDGRDAYFNNIYADLRLGGTYSILLFMDCIPDTDNALTLAALVGVVGKVRDAMGIKDAQGDGDAQEGEDAQGANFKLLITDIGSQEDMGLDAFLINNGPSLDDVLVVVHIDDMCNGILLLDEDMGLREMLVGGDGRPVVFSGFVHNNEYRNNFTYDDDILSYVFLTAVGNAYNKGVGDADGLANADILWNDVSALDIARYNADVLYEVLVRLSSIAEEEVGIASDRWIGPSFSVMRGTTAGYSYKAGIVLALLAACMFLLYMYRTRKRESYKYESRPYDGNRADALYLNHDDVTFAFVGTIVYFTLSIIAFSFASATSYGLGKGAVRPLALLVCMVVAVSYLCVLTRRAGGRVLFAASAPILLVACLASSIIVPRMGYLVCIPVLLLMTAKAVGHVAAKAIAIFASAVLYAPYAYIRFFRTGFDVVTGTCMALFLFIFVMFVTDSVTKKRRRKARASSGSEKFRGRMMEILENDKEVLH